MLIINNDWYFLYKIARNQNPCNVFASELTRFIIANLGSITINKMSKLGDKNWNNWQLFFDEYSIDRIEVIFEINPINSEPFHVSGETYNKNNNLFWIKINISVLNNDFRKNKKHYSELYLRLFQVFRHELEHTQQKLENRNVNGQIGSSNNFNLSTLDNKKENYIRKRFEYLTKPYEIEAFVRGIIEEYKKNKNKKSAEDSIEKHITINFWDNDINEWIKNPDNLSSNDGKILMSMYNILKEKYYSEVKRIYPSVKTKYK